MMPETKHLKLGFSMDTVNIPIDLKPLIDGVIACYRCYHRDLLSVYIIGSIAIGEWELGVSDLDVIGITINQPTIEDDRSRRDKLIVLGDQCPLITFIDNATLSLQVLNSMTPDPMTTGRARLITICGLHLWGKRLEFQAYLPTVKIMAYERTARAEALMRKYRTGDLIEPFRRNERLLIRSCAKAAMRVLSSISIMRGAFFYTSPRQTAKVVEQCVPEAISLSQRAMAIIEGVDATVYEAMSLTDSAVKMFYYLYPKTSF